MNDVICKPLVEKTVKKTKVSHQIRVLLFPYNIELQTSFGTSHSQSDKRQNALALLIIDSPGDNGCCLGIAEAGLPPKKKDVYEADILDLKVYVENFIDTFIEYTDTTTTTKGERHFDSNNLGKKLPPPVFEHLTEFFNKEPKNICYEMFNDNNEFKSLSINTFKYLFSALDYCERNNDKTQPFIRCGKSLIECLIFDCYGKFSNTMVGNFFSIPNEKPSHQTFYTAALNPDIDEIVKAAIFGSKHTQNLKIKLNSNIEVAKKILDRLNSAKELQHGINNIMLRNWSIDANCSWTPKICKQMLSEVLTKYKNRIYMVEQPFPVNFLQMDQETLKSWKDIKKKYNENGILIFADESMRNAADVEKLAPYVDGVNIKFEKCGGYREALLAVKEACKHNLLIWFGCMVGSNLNSTATSHLFSLACCSDLDGALLVTESSKLFHGGFQFKNSSISLPLNANGVGVTSKDLFFNELNRLELYHHYQDVKGETTRRKLLGDYLKEEGVVGYKVAPQ